MRRLHYAGGELILADLTCKAVLRYARALADNDIADVISVPVIGEGGAIMSAHLLIGPASQIFSVPVLDATDDPVDDSLLRELERRTAQLQPSRPAWPEEMQDIPDLDIDVM